MPSPASDPIDPHQRLLQILPAQARHDAEPDQGRAGPERGRHDRLTITPSSSSSPAMRQASASSPIQSADDRRHCLLETKSRASEPALQEAGVLPQTRQKGRIVLDPLQEARTVAMDAGVGAGVKMNGREASLR